MKQTMGGTVTQLRGYVGGLSEPGWALVEVKVPQCSSKTSIHKGIGVELSWDDGRCECCEEWRDFWALPACKPVRFCAFCGKEL